MTTVTFNIQTLEGETFSVDLPLELCEKVHRPDAPLRDYYDQYGLDHLKLAISGVTGTDQVCQKIVGKDELNIESRLLDYRDQVLTLLVTSLITVKFVNMPYTPFYCKIEKCMSVDPWQERNAWLNNEEEFNPHKKHECRIICYLSLQLTDEILVIGRDRDYFKVLFKSLPTENLRAVASPYDVPSYKLYEVTDTEPEYVWIRDLPDYMISLN